MHELPYTEMVKSGTIGLASDLHTNIPENRNTERKYFIEVVPYCFTGSYVFTNKFHKAWDPAGQDETGGHGHPLHAGGQGLQG